MSPKIYKKYPVSRVSCKSIMYRIVEKFKTTDSVMKKKKENMIKSHFNFRETG
jgi:hypothetical protein